MSLTFEQYIAGCRSRLDKIVSLELYNKLKGHQLPLKAARVIQNKSILVGAASGSYDITHLTSVMRNAFMHKTPPDASIDTNTTQDRGSNHHDFVQSNHQRNSTNSSGPSRPARKTPTFYSGQYRAEEK